MNVKSLLLAGAVSTFSVLPAMAQDVNPVEHPKKHGQIPCSSFVIERIIDGERFVAYPEQEEVILIALYNDSIYGTMVKIKGKLYEELRVVVRESGLTCIGKPLDETDAATGS